MDKNFIKHSRGDVMHRISGLGRVTVILLIR
jgi:hypothetical protein